MAASPAYPVLKQMVNTPTDQETLSLFSPADSKATEIENFLINHPMAQDLRKDEDLYESRPFMKIPERLRAHHLTSGVLSGPGRIEVPPLMFIDKEGRSGVTLMYLGTDLCGHPGLIHGGLMATLLDESLARCCFAALPNKVGMTANLNINYRAPLPAGSYVALRSKTVKVEGRKAWVEGTLESLPVNGETPIVYTEVTALFIEPKQAKTMARLYPAAAS